jgi:pentatricopeptide repeat protein
MQPVHSRVRVENRVLADTVTWNTLIDLAALCGNIRAAESFFIKSVFSFSIPMNAIGYVFVTYAGAGVKRRDRTWTDS